MDPDIPSPKKHSVRLTEIAELMNEMEYDYAHHLIRQLASEDLLLPYSVFEGQDPTVLDKVQWVQGVLQAIVNRDVEYLDDDLVMHAIENLASIMEQVEQADERFLMALGTLGTIRNLN